ncbi:hypothetical protein ACIGZJ_02925 [Kitasatospora sp. NPDC052868]|uniref:hypothetical protein n=1 Tax=Kitasatospora sp. NPDC052868 TaxID=3364060 RepID=UPI0037C6A84D
MTAWAPRSPWPGRTALAGRPVGTLWILLLIGLLTALPCAGQAQAVTRGGSAAPVPASTVLGPAVPSVGQAGASALQHARSAGPAQHSGAALGAEEHRRWTWCSADGQPPHRDNGCSSHPFCPQDAQLPNPPPQPQPAVAPRPDAAEALPRFVPAGLLVGPHPAPDLHELQVHRS